jgi:hypothetical protein
LKESAPLLYGKAYTPVDISVNVENTLERLRIRQERGQDLGMASTWRDELERCTRDVTAQATKAAKGKLERYRKNYHTYLTSQAIMQGISKDSARSYAAEQVDKGGDTLYTDRKMMLLLMDKIVKFDRTDKTRRNPTIANTTLAEEDPAVIEAVKANKKKGKGKGNVAETNVAATFVATTPRPSKKQCKFCDKAGHVESECYTKQNLEKFRYKMVSAVTVKQEPTVSGMGDVQVPIAEKKAVKQSVVPLCQDNKYTICAAEDNDASPSCRPFIKFHICKNATSQTPTITALYDTGAAVSLITPADFEGIKRSRVVIGPIPEMMCRVQNASQQPMQTEGAWRICLYLKGRPLSAAMIVTSNVAQSIVGMNIIGKRRLVMDPVTCTVDFRDEGTVAALGVLGQREDGTIADVRVLKATTIPGRHGQLLNLWLFNAERHRVHASVPTLLDMEIMAAAVNTDAMGGFSMHIPNADYEDREIKRGTLMGKAHKLSDWIPIDANAAINMAKKPERVLREHTKDKLEVIRKLMTDNVNRSKMHSALDCSSAFWQLQLRPSHCPFTAFTILGRASTTGGRAPRD